MKKALIAINEQVTRPNNRVECRVAQVEPEENIFDVAEGLFWVDCADDVIADRFTYSLFTREITAIPTPTHPTTIGGVPNVIA
jgi:hypothetical protein